VRVSRSIRLILLVPRKGPDPVSAARVARSRVSSQGHLIPLNSQGRPTPVSSQGHSIPISSQGRSAPSVTRVTRSLSVVRVARIPVSNQGHSISIGIRITPPRISRVTRLSCQQSGSSDPLSAAKVTRSLSLSGSPDHPMLSLKSRQTNKTKIKTEAP
jgi:hypothetical protein